MLLLALLGYASFRIYRKCKTAHIIESTLKGQHWMERYNGFIAEPDTIDEIIFLGNSLTEGFDLTVFNSSRMVNRGIAGDFTEGVLKRLDEVTARKPKKIFLEIGINDIIEKVPLEVSCSNYEKIIQRIKAETPVTMLYIQSALPVKLHKVIGDASQRYTESWFTSTRNINDAAMEYNKRLKELSTKYDLVFIDLYPLFLQGNELNSAYTYDGIHLTKNGYDLWQQQVHKYVEE